MKEYIPVVDEALDATDIDSLKDDDIAPQFEEDARVENQEGVKVEHTLYQSIPIISTPLSIRFSARDDSTSGAPSYATTILPDVSSKLARESSFFREVIQNLSKDENEPLIRPEIFVEVPISNAFLALTFLLEVVQNDQLMKKKTIFCWCEEWAILSALWDIPRYISLYTTIRKTRLTKFCFSWLRLSTDVDLSSLSPGFYVREGTPKNPVVYNGSPSFVIEAGVFEKDFFIRKSSRCDFMGRWSIVDNESNVVCEDISKHFQSITEMREFKREDILEEFWSMLRIGLQYPSISDEFLDTKHAIIECLAHQKYLWCEKHMKTVFDQEDMYKLLIRVNISS